MNLRRTAVCGRELELCSENYLLIIIPLERLFPPTFRACLHHQLKAAKRANLTSTSQLAKKFLGNWHTNCVWVVCCKSWRPGARGGAPQDHPRPAALFLTAPSITNGPHTAEAHTRYSQVCAFDIYGVRSGVGLVIND